MSLGLEPKDPNASCGPAQVSCNIGQLLNSLELSFHFLTQNGERCLPRRMIVRD